MTLDFAATPARLIEWEEDGDLVTLKILKFKGGLGRWFCRTLHKPLYALHHLDEKGSFIWKLCDGSATVEQILEQFEKRYGEELLVNIEKKYGEEKARDLKATHKEQITKGDAVVFLTVLQRQGYLSFQG